MTYEVGQEVNEYILDYEENKESSLKINKYVISEIGYNFVYIECQKVKKRVYLGEINNIKIYDYNYTTVMECISYLSTQLILNKMKKQIEKFIIDKCNYFNNMKKINWEELSEI